VEAQDARLRAALILVGLNSQDTGQCKTQAPSFTAGIVPWYLASLATCVFVSYRWALGPSRYIPTCELQLVKIKNCFFALELFSLEALAELRKPPRSSAVSNASNDKFKSVWGPSQEEITMPLFILAETSAG
jgi:hypothetical protein